jgi:hypothetical protein
MGAIIAALVVAASACGAAERDDEDIVFDQKVWGDAPGDTSVSISGTLTGDGLRFRNNTYAIAC